MNKAETERMLVNGIDGLMALMQAMVVTLCKSGAMSPASYAADLLEIRSSAVDRDSIQDLLFVRMLGLLVAEHPDVLARRAEMHSVQREEPWPQK